MRSIFLSASIPLPDRHPRFRDTVDVVAIRDSVRALVSAASPSYRIVFGGHPAITPIIRNQIENLGRSVREHFVVYQSLFFEASFLPDLESFEKVVYTKAVPNDLQASLSLMRNQMLDSEPFAAAFFIGGMEGIVTEFELFRQKRPNAPTFPIASTGAAAAILFKEKEMWADDLISDMKYLSLFRRLLKSTES